MVSQDTEVTPGQTITVASGDALYLIAKRYNVHSRDIISLNHLSPPYRLEIGQKLLLPPTRTYTVHVGDSLSTIAQRYHYETAQIARLNQIAPPAYVIQVGQVLILPGESAPPSTPTPTHKPEPAEINPIHGVAPGAVRTEPLPPPTLQSAPVPLAPAPGTGLARTAQSRPAPGPNYAAAPKASAQAAHALATIGPAAKRDPQATKPTTARRTAPPARPTPVELAAVTPAADPLAPSAPTPAASAPPARAEPAKTAPAKAEPPKVVEVPAPPAGGGRFMWPVKGQVISEYGGKPDGSQNDGVNIGAPRGAPVVAADTGVVAYVGNELRSYGNLLLIRHTNGLVTAYAHLDTTLVQKGARIKRGQKIGTVGFSGKVSAPQIHFEVRRGSQAVDPGDYLEGHT